MKVPSPTHIYSYNYLINKRSNKSQIMSLSASVSERRNTSANISSSSLPMRPPKNEPEERLWRMDVGVDGDSSGDEDELVTEVSVISSEVSFTLCGETDASPRPASFSKISFVSESCSEKALPL